MHYINITPGLLTICGLLAISTPASAVVLDTDADTFISIANPDTNYGTNTNLNALVPESSLYADRVRYTLIRFDLSSYTEGTVADAVLTVIPQDINFSSSQDFSIYGIPVGGASLDFNESTLTWNNSGLTFIDGQLDTSGLTYIGSYSDLVPDDEGVAQTLSTTELVDYANSMLSEGIATFIIVNTDGTSFFNKFDSKESVSGGSTLSITAVPEPGTLALALGVGVFAMANLLRKRRS
jgi:hypothetical protein